MRAGRSGLYLWNPLEVPAAGREVQQPGVAASLSALLGSDAAVNNWSTGPDIGKTGSGSVADGRGWGAATVLIADTNCSLSSVSSLGSLKPSTDRLQSSRIVTPDRFCQCTCCLGGQTGSCSLLLSCVPRVLSVRPLIDLVNFPRPQAFSSCCPHSHLAFVPWKLQKFTAHLWRLPSLDMWPSRPLYLLVFDSPKCVLFILFWIFWCYPGNGGFLYLLISWTGGDHSFMHS